MTNFPTIFHFMTKDQSEIIFTQLNDKIPIDHRTM